MTERARTRPAAAPRPTSSRPARQSSPARLLRLRMRRRAVILISSLVTAPLLLTGTAELIARALIHHRIENSVAKYLGPNVDVDTSGPALVGLMTTHLGQVEISTDDTEIGRLSGASVEAQLKDVRFSSGTAGGSVARTHVEIRMPADAILNTVQSSVQRLPVTSVTPDQVSDTLRLGIGGGMARIDVRPDIREGRVEFVVTGAEIMGRPAPEARIDKLKDMFGKAGGAGSGQAYPLSLKATSADVTETGLRITLDGGPAALKAR